MGKVILDTKLYGYIGNEIMTNDPITLQPIGYVRTDIADADIPRRRSQIFSELILLEGYTEALDGIEEYSHLFVLFWMHRVNIQEYRAKITSPRQKRTAAHRCASHTRAQSSQSAGSGGGRIAGKKCQSA